MHGEELEYLVLSCQAKVLEVPQLLSQQSHAGAPRGWAPAVMPVAGTLFSWGLGPSGPRGLHNFLLPPHGFFLNDLFFPPFGGILGEHQTGEIGKENSTSRPLQPGGGLNLILPKKTRRGI